MQTLTVTELSWFWFVPRFRNMCYNDNNPQLCSLQNRRENCDIWAKNHQNAMLFHWKTAFLMAKGSLFTNWQGTNTWLPHLRKRWLVSSASSLSLPVLPGSGRGGRWITCELGAGVAGESWSGVVGAGPWGSRTSFQLDADLETEVGAQVKLRFLKFKLGVVVQI